MEDVIVEKRGPGRPPLARPPMRSEDPRRDAAARAKEIMEHIGEFGESTDEFHIPPEIIPDGWSYEWKQHTVFGAVDPSKQIELARKGWEPVPTAHHPEMMPADTKEKNIVRKGLQLMERPLEITQRARAHDKMAAEAQMRNKREQIEGAPIGPFERTNSGRPITVNGARGIKTSFAVPD